MNTARFKEYKYLIFFIRRLAKPTKAIAKIASVEGSGTEVVTDLNTWVIYTGNSMP